MNFLLLVGLVVDTFLITSVNGLGVKDNLKTYLGIETFFSIVGFCLGSFLLLFCPSFIIKFVGGFLIIFLQILDLVGFDYPEKVNACLLGIDSLIVFSLLSWFYIPVLFLFEFCAILVGSWCGSRFVKFLPYTDYYGNIVMLFIGFSMFLL